MTFNSNHPGLASAPFHETVSNVCVTRSLKFCMRRLDSTTPGTSKRRRKSCKGCISPGRSPFTLTCHLGGKKRKKKRRKCKGKVIHRRELKLTIPGPEELNGAKGRSLSTTPALPEKEVQQRDHFGKRPLTELTSVETGGSVCLQCILSFVMKNYSTQTPPALRHKGRPPAQTCNYAAVH